MSTGARVPQRGVSENESLGLLGVDVDFVNLDLLALGLLRPLQQDAG